jgi:1-phosphofructokinase
MKLVTITLNPAIDEMITLAALRPGHVHRAIGSQTHAGGKGVNVASCLADWGLEVTATGILGAENAGVFEALFTAKNIEDRFLRVVGATRTNIKLGHDGDTTDINLPGLRTAPDAVTHVLESVLALGLADSLVVLAGSLPEGLAPDTYAGMISVLAKAGARVLLDVSGTPLNLALEGTTLPFAIKPNRAELEAYCGHALPDHESLIAAARQFIARGMQMVVVSLGAEGALFVTAQQTLHAALPALHAASTVGAGDAMVAGLVAAQAEALDLEKTACLATAFAVAKLGQAGPNLPPRSAVLALADSVKITPLGV